MEISDLGSQTVHPHLPETCRRDIASVGGFAVQRNPHVNLGPKFKGISVSPNHILKYLKEEKKTLRNISFLAFSIFLTLFSLNDVLSFNINYWVPAGYWSNVYEEKRTWMWRNAQLCSIKNPDNQSVIKRSCVPNARETAKVVFFCPVGERPAGCGSSSWEGT